MSYKEEYDKYNLLEKDVLIGMLIEKYRDKKVGALQGLKTEQKTCAFYMAGTDTSCRCIHCGKLKWEHTGFYQMY